MSYLSTLLLLTCIKLNPILTTFPHYSLFELLSLAVLSLWSSLPSYEMWSELVIFHLAR
jgi:hypothetical protein